MRAQPPSGSSRSSSNGAHAQRLRPIAAATRAAHSRDRARLGASSSSCAAAARKVIACSGKLPGTASFERARQRRHARRNRLRRPHEREELEHVEMHRRGSFARAPEPLQRQPGVRHQMRACAPPRAAPAPADGCSNRPSPCAITARRNVATSAGIVCSDRGGTRIHEPHYAAALTLFLAPHMASLTSRPQYARLGNS